jgi:hypothetical protein
MIVVQRPADELSDVAQRREQRFLGGEARVHAAQLATPLHVDAVGTVDHHLADARIVEIAQDRLQERAQALLVDV